MRSREDDYFTRMLRARWQQAIVLGGAFIAAAVAQIRAADVVAPNALLTQQGDTGNLLPILSPKPIRYQQVFDHTQFATFGAGGEYITQIAFRVHSPGFRSPRA